MANNSHVILASAYDKEEKPPEGKNSFHDKEEEASSELRAWGKIVFTIKNKKQLRLELWGRGKNSGPTPLFYTLLSRKVRKLMKVSVRARIM